jgi:prephenate dehydrogenase
MTVVDAPPFPLIAIAGVGLIGGSIALAVRERWPATRIVGVDRPAILAHALGGGAIDRGAASLGEAGPVDLLVLAASVRQNLRLLSEAASLDLVTTVITDVGGTKRDIVEAARTLAVRRRFVGGHPLGGAERGGFGFARPDLFRGRPWIFTPDADGEADAGTTAALVSRLAWWVQGMGAKPTSMAAADHDRAMAFLSHLPQLTATALMDVVGQAVQQEGLRLAGRGLVDTTRLASSPASVWRDICSTNAESIGEALDALIAQLVELRADLPIGQSLGHVFDSAERWRAALIKDKD